MSAVSIHAYAHLLDKYALLSSGCSMGDKFGPMIVSREPLTLADLSSKIVAIPGTLTTGYLAFRLLMASLGHPEPPKHEIVPFDKIIPAVASGQYEAGLIIHEGQLTYQNDGLKLVVDLGVWWMKETGLPLPLGGNVIRRDLGPDLIRRVSGLIKQSISYGLDHRKEALAYALTYARDMDRALADKFVKMYVNDWTLDYGARGREAVKRLLDEAHKAGIIPKPVDVQFVE